MNKQERDLYLRTLKRLARLGMDRPDRAILFLADEAEYYRARIRRMRAELEDCFEENKTLREMNTALSAGFDTIKADIAKRMIDTARKQAFLVGDNQYISISELEEIVKEMEGESNETKPG